MEPLRQVLFVLWVFAPAGIANMVPIFAAHTPAFKRFAAPMDGGRTFRGKRILGDHKTWRGLVAGIIAATLVLALQQYLAGHAAWFAWVAQGIDYRFGAMPTLVVGPLFAVGALGGDALKSFFKRQAGVSPGQRWFPFDQLDYVVGGAVAVAGFIRLAPAQYALLAVVWVAVHVIATGLGYALKLKEAPL